MQDYFLLQKRDRGRGQKQFSKVQAFFESESIPSNTLRIIPEITHVIWFQLRLLQKQSN